MTEVIQRRSKPNTDDEMNTLPGNGRSNGRSNGGNGRHGIMQNHPKKKSVRSTSTVTPVTAYIMILTFVLIGITLLHQWEHPTTTTYTSPANINISDRNKSNQRKNDNINSKNQITVAYVVTITSCNGHAKDATFQIVEGASVLQHSIHINSIRYNQNHNNNNSSSSISSRSAFDYQMYAFYHPDAEACAIPLLEFGYIIEARPTPVLVADIQNELLRERIVKNGCCGEKELIKLEAFTLTQYPLVVMLDIDTLILQPLDGLFQFLLPGSHTNDDRSTTTTTLMDDDLLYYPNKPASSGRNANATTIPSSSSLTTTSTIDFLYTTDYGMVRPYQYIKPVQGGFVILRPNQTVYHDFVRIVQEGDFQFEGDGEGGWGGRTGRFWGALTFQGLMPYYFQILYPNRALELNWCKYNNMGSPVYDIKKNDPTYKVCMTLQDNCEDCRLRPIQNISLVHFTVCQKPWLCMVHAGTTPEHKLCRAFHHEWFQVRSMMEQSWGRSGVGPANFHNDHFYGYCKSHGQHGYQSLQQPYGLSLTNTT